MKNLILPILLASFLQESALQCRAQLLVYSNFEASTGYTSGSSVSGLAPVGATGISGTWTVGGGSSTQFTAQTGTLSYSGGDIVVNGGSQFLRMNGGNGQISIALSSTITDTQNYYFSFLMRGTGITSGTEQAYVQWGQFATSSAERIDAGIGGTGTTSQWVYGRDTNGSNQGTGVLSDTAGSPTPFAVASGSTYFIAGKLVSSGSFFNEYRLWVNPTSSTTEGQGAAWASPDILTSNTFNQNIVYLSVRNFSMAGSDTFDVDEIRFGTTWNSVMPIPEPSVLSLLICGGTLAACWLRRGRTR